MRWGPPTGALTSGVTRGGRWVRLRTLSGSWARWVDLVPRPPPLTPGSLPRDGSLLKQLIPPSLSPKAETPTLGQLVLHLHAQTDKSGTQRPPF